MLHFIYGHATDTLLHNSCQMQYSPGMPTTEFSEHTTRMVIYNEKNV